MLNDVKEKLNLLSEEFSEREKVSHSSAFATLLSPFPHQGIIVQPFPGEPPQYASIYEGIELNSTIRMTALTPIDPAGLLVVVDDRPSCRDLPADAFFDRGEGLVVDPFKTEQLDRDSLGEPFEFVPDLREERSRTRKWTVFRKKQDDDPALKGKGGKKVIRSSSVRSSAAVTFVKGGKPEVSPQQSAPEVPVNEINPPPGQEAPNGENEPNIDH
jgi:hypothetical protein